jgi:hypothetical protein
MKKESQKRSLLQRLHESANVGGLMMEKLSPNLQELMDNLRGADNTVRELAAGGPNGLSLKELLKAAKKSLNDARYLQSVGYLGSFYNRLEDINKEFSRIRGLADKEHLDFLSKGLDDEGREHLLNLHKQHVKACSTLGMNKFGGLFNLFSGFKRWEKLNPSFTKELRNSIVEHVRAAERVYNVFNSTLKEMGSLRASRKIEGYLKDIEKIAKVYVPAKVAFENFYKSRIKSYVDKINEAANVKPLEELTVTEDSPSAEVPVAATETPIQKAFPNWGKAVPVSSETVAKPEFEEDFEEDVELEPEVPVVQEPVKTQPMPAVPELEVPVRQPVKEEVKTEVVPEVKTVENKSPELTVPGTKPLKPPSKKSQEALLDDLLKQHVKSVKSSFEIRKRKVILKKALA